MGRTQMFTLVNWIAHGNNCTENKQKVTINKILIHIQC